MGRESRVTKDRGFCRACEWDFWFANASQLLNHAKGCPGPKVVEPEPPPVEVLTAPVEP